MSVFCRKLGSRLQQLGPSMSPGNGAKEHPQLLPLFSGVPVPLLYYKGHLMTLASELPETSTIIML